MLHFETEIYQHQNQKKVILRRLLSLTTLQAVLKEFFLNLRGTLSTQCFFIERLPHLSNVPAAKFHRQRIEFH